MCHISGGIQSVQLCREDWVIGPDGDKTSHSAGNGWPPPGLAEFGVFQLGAKSRSDVPFRSGCFGDQETKRIRGVTHQAIANRPLAVDETPDGAFVNSEAPRSCRNAAKHLDAMREVITRILHWV